MGELSFVLGCGVGLLLLQSGAMKALRPSTFRAALRAYDVLPRWILGIVVIGVPLIEITLGGMLVSRRYIVLCAAASAVLFLSFAIVQLRSYSRGLRGPCGCFGGDSTDRVSGGTIARALLLACGSVALIALPTEFTADLSSLLALAPAALALSLAFRSVIVLPFVFRSLTMPARVAPTPVVSRHVSYREFPLEIPLRGERS